MTVDKNKNIASIEYNHLNLPSKVTKNNGEYLKYVYTATGAKLSQVVYNASDVQQKKSDYLGEFFYENDTLRFINHEEGRVVIAEHDEEYQYTLKDHLGNIRITFTTKEEVDNIPATMDTGNESAEQERFGAYNSFNNQALDPTPAESAGDKILILNGSTLQGGSNGQVGLTRSFAVVPGDVVTATVNAKYEEGSGTGNLTGFAAALTQAFLLTPAPGPTEGITPFEALDAFGSAIASGGRDGDENLPQGFLNILVFDKDYNLVDAAFEQVGTSTALTATLEIRQPGFVYVFLSNDGVAQQQIGFDNYGIDHMHSPVIQSQDYYAFGLTFNSYQRENSFPNHFRYNGKEEQDELDLRWLDYGARMYRPEIGRFNRHDIFVSMSHFVSPYGYAENNPVNAIDIAGNFKFSSDLRNKFPRVTAYLEKILPLLQYNDKIVNSINEFTKLDHETIRKELTNGEGPEIQPWFGTERPSENGAPTWGTHPVPGSFQINIGDLLQVFEDALKNGDPKYQTFTEVYGFMTLVTVLHEYVHDASKRTGFHRGFKRERFDSPDDPSYWEKQVFGRFIAYPTIKMALSYPNDRKTPEQTAHDTAQALMEDDPTMGRNFPYY